jgi:prophage regulatory protein
MAMSQDTEDRIMDADELEAKVRMSKRHIARMEKRGQFPRRIQLAEGRVGWSAREVLGWIETKKSQRSTAE